MYQAKSGIVEISDYGMRLAEMSRLPSDMLDSSWVALHSIKQKNGNGIESTGQRNSLHRRKLILQVRLG